MRYGCVVGVVVGRFLVDGGETGGVMSGIGGRVTG